MAFNWYRLNLFTVLVRKAYDLNIIRNISLNITNFY